MQSNDGQRRPLAGKALATAAVMATAILSLSFALVASASTDGQMSGKPSGQAYYMAHSKKNKKNKKAKKHQPQGVPFQQPVRAQVSTPGPGDTTSNAFNIDVSLLARNATGNALLAPYRTGFLDPTGPDGQGNPAFHPGASRFAPGLVVTLSTTPTIPNTPLVGPNTNLAGVFEINSVTQSQGLTESHNDWQVSSPGFFGTNTPATLTVYAVAGTAPDAVPAGGLQPISNVVRETFNIGS